MSDLPGRFIYGMAVPMFTKVVSSWNSRTSHKYTKMEPRTYGQRLHTNRSPFDDSVDRRGSSMTKWPDVRVEDSLQNAMPMRSPGVHSTAELVYEAQPPKQQITRPSQRIKHMFTHFPWRDMSWMVGVTFAVGSAFFIVNGFFLVLPLTNPSTNFKSEIYWTGATSLIGGVIFILGGFAGILEALNLNRGGQVTVIEGITVDVDTFDMEMKSDEEARRQITRLVAPFRDSTRDFPLSQTLPSNNSPITLATANPNTIAAPLPALYGSSAFIFWPNTPQLRTIYFRDLCFIAAIIQSIGTFIFMLAIITSFPGVIDLTNVTLFYTANLLPATLGGVLFITASVLQMITTQPNWYTPRPKSVEWHVGFWNVIGSIGFTLAGALFYLGTTEGSIQASCASLWGSFAFMVGGLLQWYVAMKNCP